MGLDVLKKLRGEAQARQTKNYRPQAQPKYEPAHKYFVNNNWKDLLDKRPKISLKESGAREEGPTVGRIVALDCEMVGVGPNGGESALARVSIVDYDGNVLVDWFVRPKRPVTDYRTRITGIYAHTLRGPKVLPEETAQQRVAEMLKGKVVVGHSLANDFQALNLFHPLSHIRDTATYRPLRPPGAENKMPSLQRLSAHWLGEKIHEKEHDSSEDARMALRLYKMRSRHWEKTMRTVMAQSAGGEDEGVPSDDDEGELVQPPQTRSERASGKKRPRSKEVKLTEPKVDTNKAEPEADTANPLPANPGKKLRKRLKAIADQEAAKAKLAEKEKRRLANLDAANAAQSRVKNPNRKRRKHLKALAAQAAGGTASTSLQIRNPSKKQRARLKAAAAAAAAAGEAKSG